MIRALFADESGATAVFTALSLAAVMGFVALGIEAATGLQEQRSVQNAADAAALAAALGLRADSNRNPLPLAHAVLAQNGIDAASGHQVALRLAQGRWPENPIEVSISRPRSPRFAGLLGDDGGSVEARAVAKLVPEATGCLLGLADSGAIRVGRPSDLVLDGCTPLSTDLGLSRIRTAEADPYRSIPLPAAAGCQAQGSLIRTPTVATSSGGAVFAFCGGLTIAPGGQLLLQPGTYLVTGGPLTVQPGGSLAGRGITLILAAGSAAHFAASAAIDIEAPATGPLAGLAIAGTSPGQASLLAGRSQRIVGAVHLPGRTLAFAGSANSPCTHLIASRILISGETRLENRCTGTGTRPLVDRVARLVE